MAAKKSTSSSRTRREREDQGIDDGSTRKAAGTDKDELSLLRRNETSQAALLEAPTPLSIPGIQTPSVDVIYDAFRLK